AHRLRDAGHRTALARTHGLHHVGHVPVHLEQLVDFLDLDAGAGRDPLLAAGFEDVWALAPLTVHRIDHRDLALYDLVVDPGVGDLVLHLGNAGHHAHQAADAAHVGHLHQLLAHVGEVQLALAHLLGDARGLFGVDIRGGLFDQRHHVAHAENPAGDT